MFKLNEKLLKLFEQRSQYFVPAMAVAGENIHFSAGCTGQCAGQCDGSCKGSCTASCQGHQR